MALIPVPFCHANKLAPIKSLLINRVLEKTVFIGPKKPAPAKPRS